VKFIISAFLCCFLASTAQAQDLHMIRAEQSFPEAMALLQEAITEQGYTVSRVQRVDIGLTSSGYRTDKYRVVFFGKPDEVREMSARHVDMVPYLPLKIALFAEGEDTILLASGFTNLQDHFSGTDVAERLEQWDADIAAILEAVRSAD